MAATYCAARSGAPRFTAIRKVARRNRRRTAGLVLAGCQTSGPTGEFNNIDKAQGSSENISSLSAVIQRNPQDPEGYNVRGSAYGRGGQYQAALKDFNQAIQLNPNFYQAYSNRALIQRFLTGRPIQYPVAGGPVKLHGALIEIDESTGRALKIERIAEMFHPSHG